MGGGGGRGRGKGTERREKRRAVCTHVCNFSWACGEAEIKQERRGRRQRCGVGQAAHLGTSEERRALLPASPAAMRVARHAQTQSCETTHSSLAPCGTVAFRCGQSDVRLFFFFSNACVSMCVGCSFLRCLLVLGAASAVPTRRLEKAVTQHLEESRRLLVSCEQLRVHQLQRQATLRDCVRTGDQVSALRRDDAVVLHAT